MGVLRIRQHVVELGRQLGVAELVQGQGRAVLRYSGGAGIDGRSVPGQVREVAVDVARAAPVAGRGGAGAALPRPVVAVLPPPDVLRRLDPPAVRPALRHLVRRLLRGRLHLRLNHLHGGESHGSPRHGHEGGAGHVGVHGSLRIIYLCGLFCLGRGSSDIMSYAYY